MKKFKICYLLFFLSFFSLNHVLSQDFTVSVRGIVENYNGDLFSGYVRFNINENLFLEGHTIHIETLSQPGGSSLNCLAFNDQVFDPTITLGTTPEDACEGEYCFRVIKNKDNPNVGPPCDEKVCVYVPKCYNYTIRNGRIYPLKEPECKTPFKVEFPSDNLSEESNILNKELGANNSSVERSPSLNLKSIFPNPFYKELNIEIVSRSEQQITVQLINNLGQVIFDKKHNLNDSFNSFVLNLENPIQFGNYFLVLIDELGERYYKQVVCIKQ